MVEQTRVGPSSDAIREWIVTSSGPTDVLEGLDSYDIEWYVTDTGDLWIRQWQLGAEGFIPAERVSEIQQGRDLPTDAERLDWLSRNLSALRASHPGEWIAIADGETIAATELPALMAEIEARGFDNPFITQIPAGEVVSTTTYSQSV